METAGYLLAQCAGGRDTVKLINLIAHHIPCRSKLSGVGLSSPLSFCTLLQFVEEILMKLKCF